MSTKFYDKIGNEINVGDFVLYTVGTQQCTELYFGVVEHIETEKSQWKNGAMVRPYPDGRLLTNPRKDKSILVINGFKEQNAEYFI